MHAMQEFKSTAHQANQLLTSLQMSSENIKGLVKHEVAKAVRIAQDEMRGEVEMLKARVRELEGKAGIEPREEGQGEAQGEGDKEKEKELEKEGKKVEGAMEED